MKVKDLIVELQKHDPEVEVFIEGCDCMGDSNSVVTEENFYREGLWAHHYMGNKNVIITRSK